MSRAMSIFWYFLRVYLKDGFDCNLVTLYLTVMEVKQEVEINEYERAVLRKMKYLLGHGHGKHYCEIFFPDQIEYILQRKTAMAMSGYESVFATWAGQLDALLGFCFNKKYSLLVP